MITSWDIYWITRLDAIQGLCVAVVIVGVILLLLSPIYHTSIGCSTGRMKTFWMWVKIAVIATVFASLVGTLLPSSKEFAAIYLIPKIANNEQVQKIPDNALKLLNGNMEQWLSEMTTKKK